MNPHPQPAEASHPVPAPSDSQVTSAEMSASSPSENMPQPAGHSRRSFLGRLGAVAASVAATGLASGAGYTRVESDPLGAYTRRRERAYKMRALAANGVRRSTIAPANANGDESLYPNRIGNFGKGMPHNDAGEVDTASYEALLRALASGKPQDFAAIPLSGNLRLHSPQAAFSLAMQGDDTWGYSIPPAPAFASAEIASEIAENYWMALTRDIPFADYDLNPVIAKAAADLSRFSGFKGPKSGGSVTPATLYRTAFPGVGVGPYISQFLLQAFFTGAVETTQRCRFPVAGSDFVTDYDTWLALMRGNVRSPKPAFETGARYIRSMRDLAEWVHSDHPSQAALHAAMILRSHGPMFTADSNPYRNGGNQEGFVTFGPADLLATIADAAGDALRAAWYQKWMIHRRVRPEEFAGQVHRVLNAGGSAPVHSELFSSEALEEVYAKWGSHLLPLAYPEGCPLHSAYPSGHATFAGATITVLKAFSCEDATLPDPVVPSADGSTLLPWTGAPLTVRGELNKLASNIAIGRVGAGVHWRTDAVEGMLLGEQVAISLLRDRRACYKEAFTGFKFTKFDGTVITV